MYFLDNNGGIATNHAAVERDPEHTTPLWFTEGDGNKGISWPGEDWVQYPASRTADLTGRRRHPHDG